MVELGDDGVVSVELVAYVVVDVVVTTLVEVGVVEVDVMVISHRSPVYPFMQ